MGNAKGSFGLVISHSLDSSNEVVVAARGQTMAIAFYPQMGCALFGSEATATKVGMGYAIDGNLLSDQEMAQLASTGTAQRTQAHHLTTSPVHLTTHSPVHLTTHTHRRLPGAKLR